MQLGRYSRICIFAVLAGLVAASVRAESEGSAFRARLLGDLESGIRREHAAVVAGHGAGKPAITLRYAWVLSAMVSVHQQTGNPQLLDWAKADLLELVRLAQQP